MDTDTNNTIGMVDDYVDQPIPIQSDETDEMLQYDHNFHHGIVLDEEDNPGDDSDENELTFDDEEVDLEKKSKTVVPEPEKQKAENDLDFEDDLAKKEDDDVFKAEEAIEQLKKLGYKVGKDEEVDPQTEKLNKINELDRVITNINNFINQDDIVLCRQRVIQDLTDQYNKRGLSSEINGEDFKAEVDIQMEEYEYNSKLTALEAKTIRNEMKQFVSEKESEKNKINTEIEVENTTKIKQNRLDLQKSFKSYNNKVLFGQKLTPELIKTAYAKMVSGEVAETINNDKNIQAEFALFLELREKISKPGGATYGEGVADAVKALNGTEAPTKTSLNRTVQRPSSGNSLHDRYSSWASRTEVNQDK